MNLINRNNYEEYFLLYADGELDAATKLEVENFIWQNRDLAVELDMLMQTKSLPEDVLFDDKDLLLRTEGDNINETNYQEYFLLYIDNELSKTKREEVEKYVLQHPKLQDEFTTLKQSVLTPEVISYGDKKDLYRTEKKRVIYLQPLRFLAAAIFIGACAIGVWMWQKPTTKVTVADVNSTQHPTTKQNEVALKPVDTAKQQMQLQQAEQNLVAQQSSTKKDDDITKHNVVKKKSAIVKQKENDIAIHNTSTQQKEIDIHKPIEQNNIVKQQETTVITDHDVAISKINPDPSDLIQKPVSVKRLPAANDQSTNNNDYKPYNVAYKEINTDDENNSLRVGMLDLNKTKVKNLFKKAGRLFGNKANKDENENGKLQVANFTIQTIKQ